MNRPTDTDPESSRELNAEHRRSVNAEHRRSVNAEHCRSEDSKPLHLLEVLIDKIIMKLQNNSFEPKVQDALRAIQLKQKVVQTSEAERIFWQEIDAIRTCELTKFYAQPFNLEDQIRTTILRLKDQVRNGILPVKTITDAFNQGKSEQARFSYHRIGRLLSTMGFRKAKTQNGSSAIIWDDKLLSGLSGPPDKGDDRELIFHAHGQEPNSSCDKTDHEISKKHQ